MIFLSKQRRASKYNLYKEVVLEDVYKLRSFVYDPFDFVLDIGANLGFFSCMARFLFPKTNIIAIEPHPDIYVALKKNINGLGIKHCKAGLSNTSQISLFRFKRRSPSSTSFQDYSGENNEEDQIISEGISLTEIIQKFKINLSQKVMMKCDCEGGEAALLDEESTNIVQRMDYAAFEFHNPAKHKNVTVNDPDIYKNWMNNFSETHEIIVGDYNRYGLAYGYLKKKNYKKS